MTDLLVGLLVCVGIAVAVIVVVALPHLREGAPLLSPEGERIAEGARRKAAQAAAAAADTAGALKDKVSAVTSPTPEQPVRPQPVAGPPRQVASAAATPAPGTPLVTELSAQEQADLRRVQNPQH